MINRINSFCERIERKVESIPERIAAWLVVIILITCILLSMAHLDKYRRDNLEQRQEQSR